MSLHQKKQWTGWHSLWDPKINLLRFTSIAQVEGQVLHVNLMDQLQPCSHRVEWTTSYCTAITNSLWHIEIWDSHCEPGKCWLCSGSSRVFVGNTWLCMRELKYIGEHVLPAECFSSIVFDVHTLKHMYLDQYHYDCVADGKCSVGRQRLQLSQYSLVGNAG